MTLYNRVVQRFCAFVLAMAFSFQLMTPLFAAAEPEASLPACCRKDGKHACGMALSKKVPAGKVSLTGKPAKCNQFPTGKSVAASGSASAIIPVSSIIRRQQTREVKPAEQKQAPFQLSFARTAPKRGPPEILAA